MNELNKMKYYFTKFGDVYAAFEFAEFTIDGHFVLIQGDKLLEYQALSPENKTLENSRKYGWVIPKSLITRTTTSDRFQQPELKTNPISFSGEFDRRNMFIIGAGASANCVAGYKKEAFLVDILRPPLGNELFNNRFSPIYEKYKGVKLSLIDLQQSNVDVEAHLEQEWKEIAESGNEEIMSRHINIQFYLQEVLKEISFQVHNGYYETNLYAQLANKLQKLNTRNPNQHYAFISFNQDTILESFISDYFRRPINNIDDYIEVNESPFCIFKPHGSWNWGWKFPKKIDKVANWLFETKANFSDLYYHHLGNYVDMVDWYSYGLELEHHKDRLGKFTIDKSKLNIQDNLAGTEYYPALLLPYRDKDEFTMPPRHYHCLTSYLGNIETLIIIGWKGNEALFNQKVEKYATKIRKVVIVDPNPTIVEANLQNLLTRKGIVKKNYGTFEEFILSGVDSELA